MDPERAANRLLIVEAELLGIAAGAQSTSIACRILANSSLSGGKFGEGAGDDGAGSARGWFTG